MQPGTGCLLAEKRATELHESGGQARSSTVLGEEPACPSPGTPGVVCLVGQLLLWACLPQPGQCCSLPEGNVGSPWQKDIRQRTTISDLYGLGDVHRPFPRVGLSAKGPSLAVAALLGICYCTTIAVVSKLFPWGVPLTHWAICHY